MVAISVHLDDAVFSVGAALARAARRGANVTVLTVLANDADAGGPAGEWDTRAGFANAREAARARRAEDRRACELLGARPVWLPFGDKTYGRGVDDGEIAAAVTTHLVDAEVVLVPGFPLMHEDHRWLSRLAEETIGAPRVGHYVEQPYAALWTPGPPASEQWRPLAAAARDRVAKLRAFRAYRSQLPLLAPRVTYRTTRYELLRGGEAVLWN